MRVYELYPTINGFSTKSVDYNQTRTFYQVAAVNVKQAYYFAHNRAWADGPNKSLGLLAITGQGRPETRLWNGKRVWGRCFKHGDGKRKIVATMRSLQKE